MATTQRGALLRFQPSLPMLWQLLACIALENPVLCFLFAEEQGTLISITPALTCIYSELRLLIVDDYWRLMDYEFQCWVDSAVRIEFEEELRIMLDDRITDSDGVDY
jgi:hypothetical protein